MADLIDRQAVRLIESDANAYTEEWNDDYEKGFTDALNKVIALPSAEPERKTGQWDINYLSEIYRYRCTVCNAVHRARYDFCPSCGAKMKG